MRKLGAEIDAMGMAWFKLLGDLTPAELLAALTRHLATSHWLPAVADLRAIASAAVVGRARAGEDAWGDVLEQVGATGRYRSPRFADPITARCVARLGWEELCASENAVADRARFAKLYDTLAREAAEDAAVAGLPGVARPALPATTAVRDLAPAAVQRALAAGKNPEASEKEVAELVRGRRAHGRAEVRAGDVAALLLTALAADGAGR